MERRSSIVDTVVSDELRRLNSHLPKSKKTLKTLLVEATPSIPTVRGDQAIMKKAELEKLASFVPANEHEKLKLPFVFLRRLDLGSGAYELLGDQYEQYTIARLIGAFKGEFEEFRYVHPTMSKAYVFYRPQIVELMSMIHSLVVLGFSTA